MSATPAPAAAVQRPEIIGMQIHTGMLESLGLNMYTTIAKSLVEFIANSFDADAKWVKIEIPFDKIDAARKALKAAAKKETAEGKRDDFKKIYESLPDDIEITIEDDGHGMTVLELENKYLSISRNRRKEQGDKSESGHRNVMGRKGLGKLAGFGTAGEVIVWSKRKGETYATTIAMNYDTIKKEEIVGNVKFGAKYDENLNPDASGTKITLRKLRCDSLRSGEDSIENTIARNFFLTGDDFKIYLNHTEVQMPVVDYDFIYPSEAERTKGELAPLDVIVDEGFNYPILGAVKFRARGKHVAAYLRGARIYCNRRLAAGPTLLKLESGMHNFHATDYMECIIHADVLDQHEIDLISTNRSALKTENEVVDAFVNTVTALMKDAIKAHSKHRDAVAEKEIENDPQSQALIKMAEQLAPRNREPAIKILKTIAAQEGVDSDIYREVAPYFVNAVNSSEVFIDLIKTGIKPTSLKSVISQLQELSQVESSDVLKLYRGRKHAITGLQILEEKSHPKKQDKQYEKELHKLLKSNPWLIKPEYGQYVTSDAPMSEVAKKLTERLGIDEKAGTVDENDDKRPDLVFVATHSTNHATVVELKSPGLPLSNKHLDQLETYMMQVDAILKNDYNLKDVRVTGYLIGSMPDHDTKSLEGQLLKKKMAEAGAATKWEVMTLPQMLDRARQTHLVTINALEAHEALLEDETKKAEEAKAAKAAASAAAQTANDDGQAPKAISE